MITNADLQSKYEEMHTQGPTAWFSDGQNEREAILEMGKPWINKSVLEIGCGEGDLAVMMANEGAVVRAIDYSHEALSKAEQKHVHSRGIQSIWFANEDFHKVSRKYSRVVLQGVLEHFDKPWVELDWIIRNLVRPGGDIITSSPCFVNPRGIVWMTLATLFDAPMSLTDLHFIHPWDMSDFAWKHPLVRRITTDFTDEDWALGNDMIADLRQRLPKVLPDIPGEKIERLTDWLNEGKELFTAPGATAIYWLKIKA
jgi:SAM-dependent methyltransferase